MGASIPRYACYLAQQSAEKALKAVLIYQQIEFPYEHNLDLIRDLIPADWALKAAHPDLSALTHWAVAGRYPSHWPEPTIEDARAACAQARAVLDSVVADLQAHSFPAQAT